MSHKNEGPRIGAALENRPERKGPPSRLSQTVDLMMRLPQFADIPANKKEQTLTLMLLTALRKADLTLDELEGADLQSAYHQAVADHQELFGVYMGNRPANEKTGGVLPTNKDIQASLERKDALELLCTIQRSKNTGWGGGTIAHLAKQKWGPAEPSKDEPTPDDPGGKIRETPITPDEKNERLRADILGLLATIREAAQTHHFAVHLNHETVFLLSEVERQERYSTQEMEALGKEMEAVVKGLNSGKNTEDDFNRKQQRIQALNAILEGLEKIRHKLNPAVN